MELAVVTSLYVFQVIFAGIGWSGFLQMTLWFGRGVYGPFLIRNWHGCMSLELFGDA